MNNRYLSILIGTLIVVAIVLYAMYRILGLHLATITGLSNNAQQLEATSTQQKNQTDIDISNAYTLLYQKTSLANGDPTLISALQTFYRIAVDTTNTNFQRAEALNGINYAYTMSNFDADDLYSAVFASGPFAHYYMLPATNAVDPLHPESGDKVEAVENALVNINQLSNALYPNHYAISRMEIATVFAYQRAAVRAKSNSLTLQKKYADQIKPLVSAYDALPPLSQQSGYGMPMRLQIMFAHASAVAFVGNIYKDKNYLDEGEQLFQQTISLGDASSSGPGASLSILDETSLARIFYASHYWQQYKSTDPSKVENVLLPLTNNPAVKNTDVYTSYLPDHKNAKVAPFKQLRAIAQVMPQLKTFLQGAGWTF